MSSSLSQEQGVLRASKDPLHEVKEMNKKQIRKQVESWIDEKDLPIHPFLKPISRFDGLYPEDDEEREAYWNFINWAMTREHAVLLSIPKPENEYDWCIEVDEFGNDISVVNTMDFQRMHPDGFNKYHYRLKKVCEKVKDLALLHSCISHDEGKENIFKRYRSLVENEFSDKAKMFLETYKKYAHWVNKREIISEIGKLNSRIRKCKRIWKENAYSE